MLTQFLQNFSDFIPKFSEEFQNLEEIKNYQYFEINLNADFAIFNQEKPEDAASFKKIAHMMHLAINQVRCTRPLFQ